ncbi:MAG: cellulase family glycosylhydrolase, partial [Eubacterium ventriosum]|nr:cellulase family glycosylhydrolase [Eubacterium ventriosum]
MKKLQAIGRKMSAGILTACLTVGMLAGTFTSGTAEQVSGAITGFTSNDFLKCYGTSIRNNYGNGNTVHLRGTNAGGLFVQESWMCSTNVRDQKTLMSNLKDRFGENQMYSLLDYYEDNYWTESDFDNCKNLGMSVIRVPFTYMNLYRYDSSKNDWALRDNAFRKLDWFVEQCSQRGIYVILDLHGAFGSQNGQDHSGEVIDNVSDVTFFSNSYNKNKTLELWKTVAAHFANNPAVAAYDTLNEPGEKAGTTGEKHWNFYNEMYNTIRSVDPNHIIIMESCWGTSNLPNPQKYGWTNVMYEYHHYTWDYISDLDGQKKSCDNIINSINNANYGVPTYIGEFTCFGLEDAWNYVMNRFNEEGINYTSWSYKTNNSGSWGIYNEKNTNKVNPTSDSIDTIKNNWGANSIGTGNQSSNGMIYNSIKKAMPGTIVFANKALTDDDYIAIKAQISNKYVCADNNGQSNLVANRTSAGGWEQFRVINNSDGTVSFQSRANNKYLCAVFDDTDKENPVIARSNAIGTWEKFYAEKQSDGTYALKTYVDNYYVQADIDDATSGILHAYGASVGTWEKFLLEPASDKTEMPGQTDNPSVPETTVAPTTKSAETVPEGYTEATVNQWTPSGKWGCYFGNWSGTASGAYKWVSDADYNIYVDKANKGSAWLVQGSYTDNVTNGHTYKVTVDVTASKACSI